MTMALLLVDVREFHRIFKTALAKCRSSENFFPMEQILLKGSILGHLCNFRDMNSQSGAVEMGIIIRGIDWVP